MSAGSAEWVMEWIAGGVLIALLLTFVVGRRVVLWWELSNAGRHRREREMRARADKKRFDRELSDAAMRAGAR